MENMGKVGNACLQHIGAGVRKGKIKKVKGKNGGINRVDILDRIYRGQRREGTPLGWSGD